MRSILVIVILLIVGLAAYVRLAPSDPAHWNAAPPARPVGDYLGEGSFEAVRENVPSETLDRLAQIALATPRTKILAGSAAEGQVTFITRSALWGFPDYTTATLTHGTLSIYGRLRFGRGDLGVNAARIKGWLAELGL